MTAHLSFDADEFLCGLTTLFDETDSATRQCIAGVLLKDIGGVRGTAADELRASLLPVQMFGDSPDATAINQSFLALATQTQAIAAPLALKAATLKAKQSKGGGSKRQCFPPAYSDRIMELLRAYADSDLAAFVKSIRAELTGIAAKHAGSDKTMAKLLHQLQEGEKGKGGGRYYSSRKQMALMIEASIGKEAALTIPHLQALLSK